MLGSPLKYTSFHLEVRDCLYYKCSYRVAAALSLGEIHTHKRIALAPTCTSHILISHARLPASIRKFTPRSSPCRQAQRYLRIPYRFTQLSRHPEVVLRRASSQYLGVRSNRHTLASFTKAQQSSKHVVLFESVAAKSVTPANEMSASVHKEKVTLCRPTGAWKGCVRCCAAY